MLKKSTPILTAWVLNGDIKGCYDNIGHVWLLENIPMDKAILKQFLKAGFVYKRHLNPTKHHLSDIGEYDPGRAGGGYRVQILRHKKRDN